MKNPELQPNSYCSNARNMRNYGTTKHISPKSLAQRLQDGTVPDVDIVQVPLCLWAGDLHEDESTSPGIIKIK